MKYSILLLLPKHIDQQIINIQQQVHTKYVATVEI